jgi:hypothetical protein
MAGWSKQAEKVLGEIWKAIPGWPYKVSSFGNIKRSVPGGNRSKMDGNLQPVLTSSGYQSVTLHRGERAQNGDKRKWNSESKQFSIHRLVMRLFYGPCPEGLHVNHRDGDKTNNRLSNLEYVTPTGNMLHAYREGFRDAKGERNGRSRLNDDKVREIRRLADQGANWHALANQFEVSYYTIKHVVNRTRWAHVK